MPVKLEPGQGEVIGEFECKTGVLRVSDPCYKPGTWCVGYLPHAKPGTWVAIRYENENGVMRILAIHKDNYEGLMRYSNTSTLTLDKELEGVVGVDSGMAGFFDAGYFPVAEDGVLDAMCSAGDEGWSGPGGACTTSGYGDGSYPCHYACEGHQHRQEQPVVIAACITFL